MYYTTILRQPQFFKSLKNKGHNPIFVSTKKLNQSYAHKNLSFLFYIISLNLRRYSFLCLANHLTISTLLSNSLINGFIMVSLKLSVAKVDVCLKNRRV